ncbi:MAG: hypothetical protein FWC10_02995 [Lentimicrobiaceae bacterium]|nr:hypothetical protein [Lentimicrobiaceae bacterium]
MLKFIYKNITFQWFVFLGLLGFSIYQIVTQTQLENQEGSVFFYINFVYFFSQHQFFGKGIIIVVLLLQLLLLQYYYSENEYSTKNSLLPGCFYLSILLLTKSLITISPFFFTLFFFLIIICIDFTENTVKIKNNLFWVGMLIALATCIDISALILLVLLMATLIINQFSRIKEFGVLFFGFALIYFYFFSYHFFVDNLENWLSSFTQIKILGILKSKIPNLTLSIISLLVLAIIYLFLIVKFKLLSESKVVIQRKRIITLNTRAFLIIACIFLSGSTYPFFLGYLFIHISIYMAMLAQEKSPLYIVNELITITILIALWLCNLTFPILTQ